MRLTNRKAAQFIIKKLDDVIPTVQEVLDKATTEARSFFERRGLEIDLSLFPNLVRFEAKCLFETPKYKSIGYQFAVLSNNGLFLIYQCEGCTYKIRVRKADEDGELPTHNLSRTLKEFCKQPNPFPQFLPGMEPENMEQFVSPNLLKLFVVWDVNKNFVLTTVYLACPNGEFGDVHFADEIPHAATTLITDGYFDDEPDELEDIDILPLEMTGTDEETDDDE
jgi:hypothetical protein